MKENCNKTLYDKVGKKDFRPVHVAEVGVWHPDTSNVFNYVMDGVRTTLVEPDPGAVSLIKESFGEKNVTLHQVAVCDFKGEVELCRRGSSTFVSHLPSSPALVNDHYKVCKADKFIARAVQFNEIDDGTIDLLSVDTEGSEWFVVKNLVSRPVVLSIETHGGAYKNPFMKELSEWLKKNGYTLWFKDKSDSVYVLKDRLCVTAVDKLLLLLADTAIAYRRIGKILSGKIKGKPN